jgi:chaperonin GroES
MKTKDGADIPITVAVGDKVLLPDYGGLMIKMDGEDVYLFRNDEILAKYSN